MHPFLPQTAILKNGHETGIRSVRTSDAEQIYRLSLAVTATGIGMVRTVEELPGTPESVAVGIRRFLRDRRGLFIVAEYNLTIAGQAEVRVPPLKRLEHAGAFTVSVHPKFQGLGIGKSLTLAAQQWACEAGLHHLSLSVFASNTKAQNLYRAVGYEVCGRHPCYIKHENESFDDDVIMIWRNPAYHADEMI